MLLKIENMMDIIEVLWFVKFLTKILKMVALIMKLSKIKNCLKNYTNQLLKNLKEEEFIVHLKKVFGVLIYLI